MEQPDEAAQSYRLAVEGKRNANDRIGAAQLLEGKLHSPEDVRQFTIPH